MAAFTPEESEPSTAALFTTEPAATTLASIDEAEILRSLITAIESGDVQKTEEVLSSVGPNFNYSVVDTEGNSPLHHASRKGCTNIVQLLLKCNFPPALETQEGDTALHLASQNGHLDVVHTILWHQDQNHRSVLLASQNHDGLTALSCAVLNSHPDVAREMLGFSTGNPMSSFPGFSPDLFPSFVSTVEPLSLQEAMKIFIVGDRGAGKSTLTKALQSQRSAWSRYTFGLAARGQKVQKVDNHFTGVITTDFCSQGFGHVIFHDLAGHTNYFHEELLESRDDLAKSVFVVVVNLSDDRQPQKRLIYWMNFLQHHCSRFQNEGSSSSKPNLLIVGSFIDQRPRRFSKTNWESGVLESHPMLSGKFNLLGKFSLNCTKFNSPEMGRARSILQRQCQRMHQDLAPSPAPSALYVLSAVLDQEFRDQSPITLKLLAAKIAEQHASSEPTLSKLLPVEPTQLESMCQVLQAKKQVFLFKNPATGHLEDTWLIRSTTINTLLRQMDEALGGPPENDEADQTLHTTFGVITSDSLQESLATLLKGVDINLTMQLLEHFSYCEKVETSMSMAQPSFFFPGLLNREVQVPQWLPDEHSGFSFAWCLTPVTGQEQVVECFMPRFLKMLLLSLIRTFLPSTPDPEASPGTLVWSRGASWITGDGVRACIITNDNSINLSMCCQGGSEIACLQLRNRIIAAMRAEKEKWQPEIETEDIIIPAISQIVQNPEAVKPHFRISDMHACIRNGTTEVSPSDAGENSTPESIESLLFFESCISVQKLSKFHQTSITDPVHSAEEVSGEFLSDFKSCLGEKYDAVSRYFSLPNIGSETNSTMPHNAKEANLESAQAISSSTQHAQAESRNPTYGQIRKHLDSLSIFDMTELLQEMQEEDEEQDYLVGGNVVTLPAPPARLRGPPGISFFNDRVDVHLCNSKGGVYIQGYHSVYLEIPQGAIPDSQPPVAIEMGIVREGPFEFPPNVKPVSPVIWFCTKEFEFTRQLKITLPHFIRSKEENRHLAFFKASHIPEISGGTFSFKAIPDSDSVVFGSCQGTLCTTHSCFLCICHNKSERVLANANYCLFSAIPKHSHIESNDFDMHFCVSYFLPTCVETLHEQYKGYKKLARQLQLVTEKGSKEAAIRIAFEQEQPQGWVAALVSGKWQISTSEVEFWDPVSKHLMMDMMSRGRYHLYPPRFTIQACGVSALTTTCMTVSFKGFKEEVEIGVILPFRNDGLHHDRSRSVSQASLGSCTSLLPLGPDAVGRLLNRHISTLISYMNMDELRVPLRQLGVLTGEELKRLLDLQIRAPDVPKKWAVESLVDMLQEKGRQGLKQLTKALEMTKEGTGHHEILEALKADPDYLRLTSQ